jgi:hypothetical protein
MGGLHGNFLCYAINSLHPDTTTSLPFTKFGTSHKPYEKHLALAKHYTLNNYSFDGNNIISITARPEDCLLVNLLCYGRAGDYNFDLKNFEVNFYDQVKTTKFADAIDLIDTSYGTNIKKTNSVSRGILREYYKFNFKNYEQNNIILEIKKQKYKCPVLEINFKDLYNFESFINVMLTIVDYFNLLYRPNPDTLRLLWEKFMEKNRAIEQNDRAYCILNAVIEKKNEVIDFNLLQESWLNARLEVLYNIEMPFEQEKYFSNTQDIAKYIGL